MRITWSEIAQATFVRFMADQAGMMAVNRAVEALADDSAPPGAFVRSAYRRLRVGGQAGGCCWQGDGVVFRTHSASVGADLVSRHHSTFVIWPPHSAQSAA